MNVVPTTGSLQIAPVVRGSGNVKFTFEPVFVLSRDRCTALLEDGDDHEKNAQLQINRW